MSWIDCDFSLVSWWENKHDKSYFRMVCCSMPVNHEHGTDLMLHSFHNCLSGNLVGMRVTHVGDLPVLQSWNPTWNCLPTFHQLSTDAPRMADYGQTNVLWGKCLDWHDTFMTHTQGERHCNLIPEIEQPSIEWKCCTSLPKSKCQEPKIIIVFVWIPDYIQLISVKVQLATCVFTFVSCRITEWNGVQMFLSKKFVDRNISINRDFGNSLQ